MSTPTETTSPTTRNRSLRIVLPDEEQALGRDVPAPKVLSPGTESSRRRSLHKLTQRLLPDEEQALGHDAPAPKVLSPRTEPSRRRSLHDELTQLLDFEEKKEVVIKFWDQFTRKGKKKVGVVESLRTLFFSSCMLSLNDGGVQYELNLIYFIH